jgi:hypothetical protein
MTSPTISRRVFLSVTAGTLAAVAVTTSTVTAPANTNISAAGAVCGRALNPGISAAKPSAPSHGKVMLLDGQIVEVTYVNNQTIRAGSSVLMTPDENGAWSILYIEV